MCAECRMNPCHPRCPNAPEPESVFTCNICKEGIAVGDEYAEIDGDYYCECCLDDMSTKELVELFGGTWGTADESDIDDGSDEAYERYIDEMLEREYD